MQPVLDPDDFTGWLDAEYLRAYRTACLLLGEPVEAAAVVHEAFLRVWRLRATIPPPPQRRAWLYRVIVAAGPARVAVPAPAGSLLGALGELPDTLRVPLVLAGYSGLSDREVAVATRRRTSTVRSQRREAHRRLGSDPRLDARSREQAPA